MAFILTLYEIAPIQLEARRCLLYNKNGGRFNHFASNGGGSKIKTPLKPKEVNPQNKKEVLL